MKESGVEVKLIYEPEMPHIYPLLPIMTESQKALSGIISKISNDKIVSSRFRRGYFVLSFSLEDRRLSG